MVVNPRASRLILVFVALAPAIGCAPREVERAVGYYVERERVGDAAARRTSAAWYLRFDTRLVQELEGAIAESDEARARVVAKEALSAAADLAQTAMAGEIDRLSAAGRAEVARRVGSSEEAGALGEAVVERARLAAAEELAAIESMPRAALRRRLQQIRAGIELLPDERGRLGRQIVLSGFALPVAIGIEAKEKELHDEALRRSARTVERAAVWRPGGGEAGELIARWAPIIAVEWPETRSYPADYDRIGGVELAGTRERVEVLVRPAAPVVYTYESEARIHGARYAQVNYVWWFSERPAMTADDAAAGHIDGGTLRLTLDTAARPMIAEVILNCGCGHAVFVSEALERAARREFGGPLPGAQYAVENPGAGRRPLLVLGTFAGEFAAGRLTLLLAAGTHEPVRVVMGEATATAAGAEARLVAVETHAYALRPYEVLDHLPLGGGYASMFGADGLVHFAGRREGVLLAPSGMLSAGQPRKRGTQRIRWDEYLFDDPTLLERCLRIPEQF